jgi:hypothetical protein
LFVAACRKRPLGSITSDTIDVERYGSNRVQVAPESLVQKRPAAVPANTDEE